MLAQATERRGKGSETISPGIKLRLHQDLKIFHFKRLPLIQTMENEGDDNHVFYSIFLAFFKYCSASRNEIAFFCKMCRAIENCNSMSLYSQ